ncbi:MAG: ORF6N domain-containing protein [Nitrospira sp.]|nr:ORF6N domain-containing protein [Nitrospira sp.]
MMAAAPAGNREMVETVERIESRILMIRGHKVVLDADLAALYGVPTKRLNEQVKRNADRFPDDFVFQLTEEEAESLRSQFATSKSGRGGRRSRPYAFTEHGAIMAANVLNSKRAIHMSVYVVRAFVRMRQALAAHKDLAAKLAELERKLGTHDEQIAGLFEAIRQLMNQPPPPGRRIGFDVKAWSVAHRVRDEDKRVMAMDNNNRRFRHLFQQATGYAPYPFQVRFACEPTFFSQPSPLEGEGAGEGKGEGA